MPYESDERLLERVRGGEVARFAVLVQRYNRSLYRVARSIVRDDHEAEDVVQQTHVAAFAHLHQFEGRAKFSTWLARIAAHEAFSRGASSGASARSATNARGASALARARTPEDLASRGEIARAIEAAIDALPPAHRTAFVLRHVEGLDTAEAAAWLGVSETNLRVLVHRACRELRSPHPRPRPRDSGRGVLVRRRTLRARDAQRAAADLARRSRTQRSGRNTSVTASCSGTSGKKRTRCAKSGKSRGSSPLAGNHVAYR